MCKKLREEGHLVHFNESEISIYVDKKISPISVLIYNLKDNKATREFLLHKGQCKYSKNGVQEQRVKKTLGLTARYLIWLLSAPINFGDPPKYIPEFLQQSLIKICGRLTFNIRKKLIKIVKTISERIGCISIVIELPSKHFTSLSEIEFYGMKFKIPSRTEEYLTHRYGKDWNIPKREYIFYSDGEAIIKS